MSRSPRRPSAPGRLAPALAATALALALALLQACSAPPGATPLYSLVIEPSPTLDSTPTPVPPGETARQAFVDSALAGDLTYHAVFKGSASGAATILPVSGSLDVAGHDYQLTMTYKWPGSRTSSYAIRYVHGTAWVRIDGGKWKKELKFKADQTNSPFAFITALRDVTLARTETVDGQRVHRLTFESGQLIAVDRLPAANLKNEEYKRTRSQVDVGDDGRPLSGKTRIEGVGRVDGQLQEISIVLDVTFSKVGAKILIKAP
jgi:hypothetical protein